MPPKDETESPFGLSKLPFFNRKTTVTLGGCIALLVVGIYVQRYFDGFRAELKENFTALDHTIAANTAGLTARIDVNERAIKATAAASFTGSDAERWGVQLERANREVLRTGEQHGLIVPEAVADRPRVTLH